MAGNDEKTNHERVLLLYKALETRDADHVQQLLASDLDWRFHGPRSHQHMKRLLSGEHEKFHFLVHSIEAFGPIVVAEGTDLTGSVYWVHAWTVSDGIITQVREYFNTAVTVKSVGSCCQPVWRSRLPDGDGRCLPCLVLAI